MSTETQLTVYDAIAKLTDNSIVENKPKTEPTATDLTHATYIEQINALSEAEISELNAEIDEKTNMLHDIKEILMVKNWSIMTQAEVFKRLYKLKQQTAKLSYNIAIKEKERLDFIAGQNKTAYKTKEETAIMINGDRQIANLKQLRDCIGNLIEYYSDIKWTIKGLSDAADGRVEYEKEFNVR